MAGEAAAVAELASYDPINAMRRIGLSPEEFSGEVTGHVKADIPLQKGIDASGLAWLVAIDYRDLSIARPIDGQLVTGAAGSITVEPRQAVVEARARLNGIPAEIEAVEPLGKADEAARRRLVKLTLDDAAREAIAPGIADLVKGAVPVSLDVVGSSRRVEADLTKAELWIPWTGWTKGPGVPGRVSFVLDGSEGRTMLSDFRLSGESFDVEGSLTLSGGSVAAAKFTRVKLNRGDDVAVSVSRTGKGFSVDVRGASLDARSVVKRFMLTDVPIKELPDLIELLTRLSTAKTVAVSFAPPDFAATWRDGYPVPDVALIRRTVDQSLKREPVLGPESGLETLKSGCA